MLFPSNSQKVLMVFPSSFGLTFQSSQSVPQHVPKSKNREQHVEHHNIILVLSLAMLLYIKA
jgi:hypothetical protein